MRIKAMLFLLLLIPAILTALDFNLFRQADAAMRQDLNPEHPGIQSMGKQNTLPIRINTRPETWVLNALIYNYDEAATGNLIPEDRYVYFYNDVYQTKLDSIQVFSWNIDLSIWQQIYTRRLVYYISTDYLSEQDYYGIGSNIPFIKQICEYDEQGRLTDIYHYYYNWDLQEYYLNIRNHMEYDPYAMTEYWQINPANGRAYYQKYVLQHDDWGRFTEVYSYASPDSLNWGNLSLENVSYIPEDTSTGADYISYFSHNILTDDDWQGGYLGMLEIWDYFWDWNGIAWNENLHNTYSYDASARLVQVLSQSMEGTLHNVSRDTYLYDTNGNVSSRSSQDWIEAPPSWETPREVLNYVWAQITSIDEESIVTLKDWVRVYPNPFSNQISISLDSKSNSPVKYGIYNIRGQLIKNIATTQKSVVWDGTDTSNQSVSNGLYFIKVEQNGQSTVRKVIRTL